MLKDFKVLEDSFVFREEKPNMFYLRGLYITMDTDIDQISKVFDGETWYRNVETTKKRTIDKDNYLYDNDEFWYFRYAIPPYGVCHLYYGDGISIEGVSNNNVCVESLNGKREIADYSKNEYANYLMTIMAVKGWHFDGCNNVRHSHREMRELAAEDMEFCYFIHRYGYNNRVYSKFGFKELLDYDVTQFAQNDAEKFQMAIEKNSFLNAVIDKKIFKRPLTEPEKAICAANILKMFAKTDIKRIQFEL